MSWGRVIEQIISRGSSGSTGHSVCAGFLDSAGCGIAVLEAQAFGRAHGFITNTNTILGIPSYNYNIMCLKPYSNYKGPYIRVHGLQTWSLGPFRGSHPTAVAAGEAGRTCTAPPLRERMAWLLRLVGFVAWRK